MEVLIEEMSSSLHPSKAKEAFTTLLKILDNVIEHPAEDKYRKLKKATVQGKLSSAGVRLLSVCGFQPHNGGEELLLAATASLEELSQARDLISCVIMSCEDFAGSSSPPPQAAAQPMDVDDDDELQKALRLSMELGPEAKRARGEGQPAANEAADRELAEELEQKDEEAVDVEFERFEAENVRVDPDAVEKINTFCLASGEKYVDPQFPPTDRSLYLNPEDGRTWECFTCHGKTELPPLPPMPKTREEAEKIEAELKTVKCRHCATAAPFVAQVRFMNRPAQWLRPGVKCEGCEMLLSYSNLSPEQQKECLSRFCSHYIRDSLNMTVGSPWKLIRSEARPEDVCQGALGNCWFACALSVVATKSELIEKMFETKDFNPVGAYQMLLCHAGTWHRILIDDTLPTSQTCEGKIGTQAVEFSFGGSLCYLGCNRRQLWAPFVEKAAAKLFGCYQGLASGNVGEAFALFTGFPIERVVLYIRKDVREARRKRREERNERRTQMLLQGLEVPDEPDSEDDLENDDLNWSKVVSAIESGYLLGAGCSEEGCEKSKHHIVEEMGLQAPHGYGILDAKEIEVEGKLVRLLKIRNPWGERAPRTWKGDWGKDSKKWTFELKRKLGVVNQSNVAMYDEMSQFWMAFEDVKEYFATVDVCRVHLRWKESRTKVWLPSGVGPGEALEVTVFNKTSVDIAIWQERHIRREAALKAKATSIDVGFAVLRCRGPGPDGLPQYDLIEYVLRSSMDCVSAEMILDGGFVYRIVPVSHALSQAEAPRKAIVAVHSVQHVKVDKVQGDWRACAWGICEAGRKKGRQRPLQNAAPGVSQVVLSEQAGLSYIIQNNTDADCCVQVDALDSVGVVSSTGSLDGIALIPPRSRQVVLALATKPGAVRYGFSLEGVCLPQDAAGFCAAGEGLHQAIPLLSPTERAVPSEEILRQAPVEDREPEQPSGGGAMDEDDEEELRAAIRLSLEAPANSGPSESNGKLRVASEPDPRVKEEIKQRVQRLFKIYTSAGVPVQEAAVRALQDANAGLREEDVAAKLAASRTSSI